MQNESMHGESSRNRIMYFTINDDVIASAV
jgi:hypothetical protein